MTTDAREPAPAWSGANQPADSRDARIGRRVLVGTLYNSAGKLVTLGTWFLLTPFILHRLGANAYGLWSLVSSVVSYGSLLDLGIGPAIAKYVAEYRVRGRMEEARSLVATAFWLYATLGILALVLSAAFAPILPHWFGLPAEQRGAASWLMLLMGAALGFSMPCTTAAAALRGLQRYDLINAVATFGALLTAAATVTVLRLGGGVVAMAAAHVAVGLATQSLQVWTLWRAAPGLGLRWRHVRREMLRPISGFTLPIFVTDMADHLRSKTDGIVIGAVISVSAVTPYAIALKLSEIARILSDRFIRVLLPLASELHAENDPAALRMLFTSATRLTLAVAVLFGCTVVLLAEPILAAWVGSEYSVYSYLVAILTVAIVIDTSGWPAGAILQAMGRHRPLAVMAIASGAANLVLSIILARRLGLRGVALGTLIPSAIEVPLFVIPYAARTLGVSARTLFADVLGPILLPAASLALVLLFLQHAIAPASFLFIAIEAIIGGLVYLGVYLAMGPRDLEREICHTLMASLRLAMRARSTG
jgi:O-antigen/teichoic acid export membrane protein